MLDQVSESTVSRLRERSHVSRLVRRFFEQRGFLEVHAPCLINQCIADPHIDPVAVSREQLGLPVMAENPTYFLQTSPELTLKCLLAAGSGSIYSLGPVFRAGEIGEAHRIEFTMLEWYEVGAGLRDGIATLGQLATEILPVDRYDVLTYRQLFEQVLSIDPIDCPIAQIQHRVHQVDPHLNATLGEDRDGLLDVLLSQVIQPQLAAERPLILTHYPISQAALAKASDDDPQTAARFELFFRGVELANGYDELLDADELVRRLERTNRTRIQLGRQPIPLPSKLIESMRSGLPQSAGVALGFDRLLMVCSASADGENRKITEVIAWPTDT